MYYFFYRCKSPLLEFKSKFSTYNNWISGRYAQKTWRLAKALPLIYYPTREIYREVYHYVKRIFMTKDMIWMTNLEKMLFALNRTKKSLYNNWIFKKLDTPIFDMACYNDIIVTYHTYVFIYELQFVLDKIKKKIYCSDNNIRHWTIESFDGLECIHPLKKYQCDFGHNFNRRNFVIDVTLKHTVLCARNGTIKVRFKRTATMQCVNVKCKLFCRYGKMNIKKMIILRMKIQCFGKKIT